MEVYKRNVEGQLIMFTAHTVGRTKYQITGCAGQGGFAQVYKAYVNCNPDDVVAFKRSSFGFAHRMHLYPDCSILVSDYLAGGTLQDLRKSFQDYMCSDPQLIKKLSDLLVKQRASLCSA
ncbi:hypothetical protein EV1_046540 [Malus domestica]